MREMVGWIFVLAGERPGQITEGKLVNTPVYLIVSSHSVTCNYIIMAEGKNTADESFNLLCRCLRVSCVVHLWSWKPINNKKTKCDKRGLVFVFSVREETLEFYFNICCWLWGGGLGREKMIIPDWMNPASWGGPLLSSPYKCLAPVAIPSFLHARAVKTGMM